MHEPHMSVVVTCTLQTYGTLHVFFCCSGHFPYCIILFLEGEPPPPRSTPWGAYRPASHVGQYLFYCSTLQCSTLLLHLLLVDRSMVVGHVLMDHMCSFMCTSHIDMTAHNPAFFLSWVALCELLYVHMTWPIAEHSRLQSQLWQLPV